MDDRNGQKARRWGLTRGGTPALRVAVPVGLVAALACGTARVMLVNPDGPYKWIAGVILGACLAPVLIALAWTLLVDRSTLPGAVANAQSTVESAWYDRAASDSFHVLLVVTGVGAGIASLASLTVVSWTLISVFTLTGLSFGISYLIRRAR